MKLLQNLFGGGDVQRDRLAYADLEIKTADLLAAKAELERQQEEEKVEIGDKVLHLLLDYEAAQRRHELLSSQLETLEQQREVTRIAYKFGRGSTSQILGMEDRRGAEGNSESWSPDRAVDQCNHQHSGVCTAVITLNRLKAKESVMRCSPHDSAREASANNITNLGCFSLLP